MFLFLNFEWFFFRPKRFSDDNSPKDRQHSDSDDELFVNTNRPYVDFSTSSSDSDEEDN